MGEQEKHTPGPWRVDRLAVNGEVVVRADDDIAYICMVFCSNKEPDARLISAAPDMLAALINVEAVLSIVRPRSDTAEYLAALGQTRAAIAKAEGRL